MTNILNIVCNVEAITPIARNHFFGFYDICPWSPDDQEIVLLRYDEILDHHPDGSDVADVCLWNTLTGDIHKIAETTAWNFQQGTRSQWLDNERIVFNAIERGSDVGRIVSRSGQALKTLDRAIASVSATSGLSPSFSRLGKHYTPYGYRGGSSASIDDPAPDDDGLWSVDLSTGRANLMFSLAMLSERLGSIGARPQFVSHPTFSPDGQRIVFAHSVIGGDEAINTHLMVANQDGSALRSIASEKVSHLHWYDNDTLVIWARFSAAMAKLRRRDFLGHPAVRPLVWLARKWQGQLRNSILSEGFYLLPVDNPGRKTKIAPKAIAEDGHCCMHPHLNIMVSDTYPDANNLLHLYLYSFDRDIRVNLTSFDHGVTSKDGGMRCDLHPRWNRAGDKISVDVCEEGIRRMAIVDVRPALQALAN